MKCKVMLEVYISFSLEHLTNLNILLAINQEENISELHNFVGQRLAARSSAHCTITSSSGKFVQSVGLNYLFLDEEHKEKQ